MEIKNIKKVEIIIQEINALKDFIKELPDNFSSSDYMIFGENENNVAELKAPFKGKNISKYIKDYKVLVFEKAKEQLKDLETQLADL